MNGIDEHRLALATGLSRDEVDEVLADLDEQIEVLRAAERAAEARYQQLVEIRTRVRTPHPAPRAPGSTCPTRSRWSAPS